MRILNYSHFEFTAAGLGILTNHQSDTFITNWGENYSLSFEPEMKILFTFTFTGDLSTHPLIPRPGSRIDKRTENVTKHDTFFRQMSVNSMNFKRLLMNYRTDPKTLLRHTQKLSATNLSLR